MDYETLLTRIIDDGIAAVKVSYADKPEKLRGAIDGFEACRGLSPAEIVKLYQHAERQGFEHRCIANQEQIDNFWYWRCYSSEVEWTSNVLSVGFTQTGQPPLLPWHPTARAVMKYAEIVGVRGEASP